MELLRYGEPVVCFVGGDDVPVITIVYMVWW